MGERTKKVKIEEGEARLLIDILMNVHANGNTVTPKPFDPTPEQWRTATKLCTRLLKIKWY